LALERCRAAICIIGIGEVQPYLRRSRLWFRFWHLRLLSNGGVGNQKLSIRLDSKIGMTIPSCDPERSEFIPQGEDRFMAMEESERIEQLLAEMKSRDA